MAGNANSGRSVREKPFLQALMMEVKAAGADNIKLRLIARALLDKALDGDMQAINAVMDRLDGKPMQQVELSGSVDSKPSGMTDEELERIAASSSAGTAEASEGAKLLN